MKQLLLQDFFIKISNCFFFFQSNIIISVKKGAEEANEL